MAIQSSRDRALAAAELSSTASYVRLDLHFLALAHVRVLQAVSPAVRSLALRLTARPLAAAAAAPAAVLAATGAGLARASVRWQTTVATDSQAAGAIQAGRSQVMRACFRCQLLHAVMACNRAAARATQALRSFAANRVAGCRWSLKARNVEAGHEAMAYQQPRAALALHCWEARVTMVRYVPWRHASATTLHHSHCPSCLAGSCCAAWWRTQEEVEQAARAAELEGQCGAVYAAENSPLRQNAHLQNQSQALTTCASCAGSPDQCGPRHQI